MNEWEGIKFIFKHKFGTAISQFLITMIATVVLDLMWAIIIGVLYSAILFMVSSSKLKIETSEFEPKSGKKSHVITITGSLFFGAVNEFNKAFEGLSECENLLIVMNGVNNMDVSGASAFVELCESLHSKGVTVSVCGVQDNVKVMLDRSGVSEIVGENYFISADDAFESLMAVKA